LRSINVLLTYLLTALHMKFHFHCRIPRTTEQNMYTVILQITAYLQSVRPRYQSHHCVMETKAYVHLIYEAGVGGTTDKQKHTA